VKERYSGPQIVAKLRRADVLIREGTGICLSRSLNFIFFLSFFIPGLFVH
jgi:hypothetical protein